MTTTEAPPVLRCARLMSIDGTAGRAYIDDLPGMEAWTGPSVTTVNNCLTDGGRGLQIWWAEAAVRSAAADIRTLADDLNAVEAWVKRHKVAGFAALNRAAERGTRVHDAAERLLSGEPHGLDPVWDVDAYPYAAALEAFFADHRPTPVAMECPVFNRALGYAGRFDLLGYLLSLPGRLLLVDWKTRAKPEACATAKATEPVQLAAYARAEYMIVDNPESGVARRVPMPKVDGAVVVTLGPDGTYGVLEVPIDDDVFDVFKAALVAAPYFHLRDDKGGVPVGPSLETQLEASLEAVGADLSVFDEMDAEAGRTKVDAETVAWLQGRARWLHAEHPAAFDALAANWPNGIPGLHGSALSDDELDVVRYHFANVEARFDVPFYDQPDPRAPAPQRRSALEPQTPPPPHPPHTVPPVGDDSSDAEVLAWITATFRTLPAATQDEVAAACAAAGIARIREGVSRDQLDTVARYLTYAADDVTKTAPELGESETQPERNMT